MVITNYNFIKSAFALISFVIIISLLFDSSDSPVEKNIDRGVLHGKTIVLDPGHGGADPGAVVGDISEAELNMKLASILKVQLEGYGAAVVLTREGNTGLVPEKRMTYFERWLILQKRKAYAFLHNGDILISIHCNSNEDSRASGAMVFYADDEARSLAENIQRNLNSLGLRSRKVAKNGFTVIKGASMPAVLVEAGFITNKTDRKLLLDKPELIAEQVTKGILENDRLSHSSGLLN